MVQVGWNLLLLCVALDFCRDSMRLGSYTVCIGHLRRWFLLLQAERNRTYLNYLEAKHYSLPFTLCLVILSNCLFNKEERVSLSTLSTRMNLKIIWSSYFVWGPWKANSCDLDNLTTIFISFEWELDADKYISNKVKTTSDRSPGYWPGGFLPYSHQSRGCHKNGQWSATSISISFHCTRLHRNMDHFRFFSWLNWGLTTWIPINNQAWQRNELVW